MTYVKQRKDWRMSCDAGEATESLENEQSSINMWSRFLSFPPTPKIEGGSHKNKLNILIFSNMSPTILIKFCGLIGHSKPNNMALSAFPGKNPCN